MTLFSLRPIPAAAASMAAAMGLGMNGAWAESGQPDAQAGPASSASTQPVQTDAPADAPAPRVAEAVDPNAVVLPTVTIEGSRGPSYKPDTSNVGGKTPQALRDIPQSVTVITRSVLDSQGATSLADALHNVPGITIGGAEGGQIGNNINLRGFTARTDIYLDGFRDRGQYYRDVFDMDQIEVLQGPSSMLFGRGSTGGVINQVTKQASLSPFTELSATAGTDGRVRSTLDTDTKLSDTSALRVNAFAQDLQTTRDVLTNKDFGLAPTLRFGIGQPTEIAISALLQHNSDMPDYGVQSLNGHPITASRDTDYGLASDHTNQDVAMLNGVVTHHFGDSWQLRNQTQLNHYTTAARETAPQALGTQNSGGTYSVITPGPPAFGDYDPGTLFVRMQSHDRSIIDSSLDNQTDLIGKFSTGFIQHEVVGGLEIGRDRYSNQSLSRTGTQSGLGSGFVEWVSLEDPSHADPASVTQTVGNRADSAANSLGICANDTLSLGKLWKLVTGARWDSFRAHIDNTVTLPLTAQQDTHFTSVREGLLFQPTQEQSYYFSYGTSFDPLLEQLTFTNGQQNLPPTKTKSYEVGGKWDLLSDRLSLTSAAFHEEQDNVYNKNTDGSYSPAGDWIIKGFNFSAAGRITDRWQLISGYMHLNPKVADATDGTKGSTPANTPKDTFTLWTTYNLSHAFELGGGANYVSSRFVADTGPSATLPAGNVDRVSVPSYVRWDATAAYHLARYEVRVNVLNLTDKHYYDALVPSDGGRSVPGIGRTELLTVSYKW